MLSIFVCEDHDAQRQTIVRIIQNTILMEELDMQLVLDAGDPYMLLDQVKTSQNPVLECSGKGWCLDVHNK